MSAHPANQEIVREIHELIKKIEEDEKMELTQSLIDNTDCLAYM